MNTNIKRLTLAAWLACVCISASYAMDRNAFLKRPVTSVNSLVNQVSSDPEVADRYGRHFGMSRSQVINYFKTFKMKRLQEDGVYSVYNVPANGELRMRRLTLKKGTDVFVDAEGTPVLQMSCGNPLGLGPTTVVAANPVQTAMSGAPEEDVRNTVVETPGNDVMAMSTPMMPATPTIPGLPTPPEDRDVVIVPGGGGGSSSAWLGLPALGLILVGINNGGGDTPPIPPPPIPEPASLIVLSGGALALRLAKKRRKS